MLQPSIKIFNQHFSTIYVLIFCWYDPYFTKNLLWPLYMSRLNIEFMDLIIIWNYSNNYDFISSFISSFLLLLLPLYISRLNIESMALFNIWNYSNNYDFISFCARFNDPYISVSKIEFIALIKIWTYSNDYDFISLFMSWFLLLLRPLYISRLNIEFMALFNIWNYSNNYDFIFFLLGPSL